MPSVVDEKTKIPLGAVSAVVTTVLACALWVSSIAAKAEALQDRVNKMEQAISEIGDIKGRLAAMDYKLDFLIKTQDLGKPK